MSRLSSVVKQHPIITFFVLAYAISWGALPFEAVRFLPSGPLFAALIVIPITYGRAGLKELGSRMIRWRVRWYWYAVALGLPLAVHATIVGLNVAAGAGVPSLAFSSVTTFLMVFAIRLVNPADGPLGEHPGWNGVALPGLQAELLAASRHHDPGAARGRLALAPLLSGRGRLAAIHFRGRPRDDDGGDVLVRVALQPHRRQHALVVVAHSVEGSIQDQGWIYMGVWLAVAIGLVVFDWKAWRGPAPAAATTQPVMPSRAPKEATPAASA